MKKLNLLATIIGSFCLLLGLSATQACADTATLTFNNTLNGETYPYDLTVNGTQQLLMCVNDHTFIQGGESWVADVFNVTTAAGATNTNPSSFPGSATPASTDWKGLAELFKAAQGSWANGDAGSAAHYNDLAWDLMDGSITTAGLAEVNAINLDIDNVLFYIWDGSPITNQYGGDAPQIMVGETPEPGSLLLLGTGLLGLALGMRRVVA